MLVTFKSRATPEITMYKEHASKILQILEKDVERGVFTVEELPAAIAKIEYEMEEDRKHAISQEIERDAKVHNSEEHHDNEHEKHEVVSFSARLYPILEMMRMAQKKQREIVWGV